MKKYLLAAVAVIGMAVVIPTVAAPTPAQAQGFFSFSFDTGDVRMAYRNGYYDNAGRWHTWRDGREAREFSSRYGSRYRDMDHDGIPNQFDRDRDGDGVPNRYDNRPNRPGEYSDRRPSRPSYPRTRRDWDGDGVPNRFDDYPRNPWRD